MKRRHGRFLLLALTLMGCGATAGGLVQRWQHQNAAKPQAEDSEITKSFAEATRLVEEKYVVEPERERITRASISAMLHTLDPHSNFFDRREFTEMQEEQSSRFFGIGVTLNERNGGLYVLGVAKDKPAENAGLRWGDAIVAVDGKETKNWHMSEALKHVRGDRGVAVTLTVDRAGEPRPIDLRVVRDEVPYPSVRNYFIVRNGIGYISLTGGFNQATSDELAGALADLKKQNLGSLVLDLRRNPGGLLKEAIQVSEVFLPKGRSVVSMKGRDGIFGQRTRTYQSEYSDPETMPLVVLINGESASASEIVAGAIQDQDRGLIVGEDSFGKGLVQSVYKLPGGTGLTLTTAKYYTPSGRSIQREYNGVSIYDYYRSRMRLQGDGTVGMAPQATPEQKTVYTPMGRPLRGGGGITPDLVVKRSEEDWPMRDACFAFARQLAAGQVNGFESYKVTTAQHGYKFKGSEFPAPDSLLADFRAFLRQNPKFKVLEASLNNKPEYARRRIRAEMLGAAYGLETAEQYLLESDEQMQQAIEALARARQMLDTARMFTPERAPQPLQR
ncbi:MAG: S41 family peptidase [Blastocatellia bacterium]